MPFFFNGFENIRFSHPKIKVPNINNWGYCQGIKSLLPSLYPPGQRPLWVGDKREEFPSLEKRG
jgi:hypothetical protein